MEPKPRRARQLGKYTLIEPIGVGGMAEIWRSTMMDGDVERPVVVKRIRRAFVDDADFVRMFMAEAKLSFALHHENIVAVLDFGREEGELFLVMEYVHGRDLLATLRAGSLGARPMPVGQALYVAREVAHALAYAHSITDDAGQPRQLVHRDVSPDNVLLSFDGTVKLTDFGIAKVLTESTDSRTATGILKGKAGYMAPEQLTKGRAEIDVRVDVYSLGIVLHEMLTGRRLFNNRALDDVSDPELRREVLPPSRFNPQVSAAVDALCLRALAENPEERFASAGALALALDPMVDDAKWGADRSAEYLRTLFHGEDGFPDVRPTDPTRLASGKTKKNRRRRWLIASTVGVSALGVVAMYAGTRTSSVIAPSVSAPPVSAPAPRPILPEPQPIEPIAPEPILPTPIPPKPTVSKPSPKPEKHAPRPHAMKIATPSKSLKRGDVLNPFDDAPPEKKR